MKRNFYLTVTPRENVSIAVYAPGTTGPKGESMLWKGEYAPTVAYSPNEVVEYDGSSYICLQAALDKTPGLEPAYWAVMAVGYEIPPGTLIWEGAWAEEKAYTAGDVVTYQNALWVALNNSTGDAPLDAEEWEYMYAYQPPVGTMLWRGAWDSEVEYTAGSVVTHAGSVWLAIADSLNKEPGAEGITEWVALT